MYTGVETYRQTDLSPLPMVHARYRNEYSFERLAEEYESLPKEPLLVRAILGTPYIPAEPSGALHLDGILAAQIFSSHPVAPIFPRRESGELVPAMVPLPLELAWVGGVGDYGEECVLYAAHNHRAGETDVLRRDTVPLRPPLWVCSDLRPQGDIIRSQEYWHKRYPESHHDEVKKSKLPNTRSGRWKEYRVPISTVQTPELRAVCVGNAVELMRLLDGVTHVGKKAGMGFGRVLQWRVASLDQDTETARQAALKARPVPARYLMETEGEMRLVPGMDFSRRGWTCPYWYYPLHDMAVVRE